MTTNGNNDDFGLVLMALSDLANPDLGKKAEAAFNAGARGRVFDWDKAARLIREHKPQVAVAGLAEDMFYTSGSIYQDGQIDRDSYTYLSSLWAKPVLILDGIQHDCYQAITDDTEWDQHTKWPDSAVAILCNDDLPNGD